MDVGNVCVFLSICEPTNVFQKIAEFDSPVNLLKNTTSIFYSLNKEAGLVQQLWLEKKTFVTIGIQGEYK